MSFVQIVASIDCFAPLHSVFLGRAEEGSSKSVCQGSFLRATQVSFVFPIKGSDRIAYPPPALPVANRALIITFPPGFFVASREVTPQLLRTVEERSKVEEFFKGSLAPAPYCDLSSHIPNITLISQMCMMPRIIVQPAYFVQNLTWIYRGLHGSG